MDIHQLMREIAPYIPVIALLALAASVSPRLLASPDPSVEGAFALAAAVSSMLLREGAYAWLPVGAMAAIVPSMLTWLAHSSSGCALWLSGGSVSALCILALRVFGAEAEPDWMTANPRFSVIIGCIALIIMSGLWIWLARGRLALGIRAVGLGGDNVRYQIVPASLAKMATLIAGGVLAGTAGMLFAMAPQGSASASAVMPVGAWITGTAVGALGRTASNRCRAQGVADVVAAVVGAVLWCVLAAILAAIAKARGF
ncbi:MAG: hypothetical protein LBK46_02700 [Oscillospiraceae bacterium]|jgi:ABC-type uncharacterized transport system permease subunit|nr:hypothetical protein [Oscillospiraceae bacterium]